MDVRMAQDLLTPNEVAELLARRGEQDGPLGHARDRQGGAAAGEVASQLAVDILFDKLLADGAPRDRDDLARRLVRAVEAAGLRIFTEAKLDRARRGMGTTATVAAPAPGWASPSPRASSRPWAAAPKRASSRW